ncbi:MAG: YbaK/EbsC family protein [Clostridia bacterium]|nr:YbaK/EbsC family protein [Clostridia bacterium]
MSIERVKTALAPLGLEGRILEFPESSATVEEAARAIGCEPERIAKTLAFSVRGKTVLIVAAGDARVENKKFKTFFGAKAEMLRREETEALTGYPCGAVCPFAPAGGVEVYLDESLKRFDTVYPAAGTAQSAVRLSLEELERAARPVCWVDVTKRPEEGV